MAVAMAFPCQMLGSKMVGGGRWIRKFSKVAGALSSRGICRANGRRLIASLIFNGGLRVSCNNQRHLLQYWPTLTCLFTITVLTGLVITLNIWHSLDSRIAASTIPAISRILFDLIGGHRSAGLVVAAIASVILHTISRTVLIWLYCQYSCFVTHNQRVYIFETGTVQVMDSRQSSLPRNFSLPRHVVKEKWSASSRSHGQQEISFDPKATPVQHIRIRAPSPSSDPRSIRWAREVQYQSGTNTSNYGYYSVGTLGSTSPNHDPFLDGHNEKVSQEKFNQRLLRKVKSYMTLSSGSRTGDSPSITTKKGLTISQPSEFRSINDLRLEVKYAEAGAPARTGSPMRLAPLPKQRETPLRASHGLSPTTKSGLTISHPFGLRSLNNLHLEEENAEARISTQPNRPIKRKPVPIRDGGISHIRGLHAASLTPSDLKMSEYDHDGQAYQISPSRSSQMSFGGSYEPTRDDRQASVTAGKFTREEVKYIEKGYGNNDHNPYHQEHSNSSNPKSRVTESDYAERWEEKKERQEEKIMAALAKDGSCLLLDYNGSGKTVEFRVVTGPNDWTESGRPSSSVSTDTLRSLPNSVCFDRLRSRTKTNDRLSGLGAASNRDGRQENRGPKSLESLYELSEASNQDSQSHRSSGADRMSGSSTSSPFSTGESSLRSFTKPPSSTAGKKGGGLFSSFLKKEPSAAALNEYSRREFGSKGVDPKDPDAATKMKVSTRRLPPEAPKPASKEPRKKKGGGPEDRPGPSTNAPGRLRRLDSLDNLSFRRKEDQLGSGEGTSMRVERSNNRAVPFDIPTLRKIDDRKIVDFPVVPEPSVARPLTDIISPLSDPARDHGPRSFAGPHPTEVSLGPMERTIGDRDSRNITMGTKIQPRDVSAERQQGLAGRDLTINRVYADAVAGPSNENESEEETNSPAVKRGLNRSLAQRRRLRKREELGMRSRE